MPECNRPGNTIVLPGLLFNGVNKKDTNSHATWEGLSLAVFPAESPVQFGYRGRDKLLVKNQVFGHLGMFYVDQRMSRAYAMFF